MLPCFAGVFIGITCIRAGITTLHTSAIAGIFITLFGAVGLLIAIRAWRSAYISVTDDDIIVRNIIHTRTFARSSVASVEASQKFQVTNRVFPVIKFNDGTHFQIGDFFEQERSYRADNPEGPVNRAISAISCASPQRGGIS